MVLSAVVVAHFGTEGADCNFSRDRACPFWGRLFQPALVTSNNYLDAFKGVNARRKASANISSRLPRSSLRSSQISCTNGSVIT